MQEMLPEGMGRAGRKEKGMRMRMEEEREANMKGDRARGANGADEG